MTQNDDRARPLRISILLGIAYDWIAAALIFASPRIALDALRLPPPPEPFHFRFAALLLVILPIFYLLAWRDPRRYSGVVGAMILARLIGFVYLVGYGAASGVPATYIAFGVADALFAAAHIALAKRAGLSRDDLFSTPR